MDTVFSLIAAASFSGRLFAIAKPFRGSPASVIPMNTTPPSAWLAKAARVRTAFGSWLGLSLNSSCWPSPLAMRVSASVNSISSVWRLTTRYGTSLNADCATQTVAVCFGELFGRSAPSSSQVFACDSHRLKRRCYPLYQLWCDGSFSPQYRPREANEIIDLDPHHRCWQPPAQGER